MGWTDLPADFRELAVNVLTERQLEIVKHEADGWTVRYTARRLALSVSTVQGHRARAHERLRYALEHPDERSSAA